MITVITPTIGSPHLQDCIDSVANQITPVKHWLVVDGKEHEAKVRSFDTKDAEIIVIPENTGRGMFYGHKIYAGIPFMVTTPYVSFLDEDNTLERGYGGHMASRAKNSEEYDVVTCRRYIITEQGEFLGADDKESIGKNILGYHLYDISTMLFKTERYHLYAPAFTKAWGADRHLAYHLDMYRNVYHFEEYLVNYRTSPHNIDFFKELLCHTTTI